MRQFTCEMIVLIPMCVIKPLNETSATSATSLQRLHEIYAGVGGDNAVIESGSDSSDQENLGGVSHTPEDVIM